MSEAKYPGSAPEVDGQIAKMAEGMVVEPAGEALRERTWAAISAESSPVPARPRWSWAIGGATLATASLVGVGFLLLPGSPTNPTVSLAQVAEAMRQVKTATWRTTFAESLSAARFPSLVKETWVRLDPPAIAERTVSAKHVMPWPQRVTTEEGMTAYYKESNRYEITRMNLQPGETMRQRVEEQITNLISPPKTNPSENKDFKMTVPARIYSPWKSQRVRRDGKELLQFSASIRPGPQPKDYNSSWRVVPTEWDIWVDPKTRLVVRTETRSGKVFPHDSTSVQITDEYLYNEEPPAGVFDLKPTAGAKITYQDWRTHEVKLTEAQRATIQAVIAESEAGWVAGDFERFSRHWDMAYDRPQPNTEKTFRSETWARNSWNGIVSDQKGRWQYWKSEVPSEVRAIRNKGYEDWTAIPESDPDILEVRVITRAAFARGKDFTPKAWDTRYYLRPDGDGYKIIHYSYRWPFTQGNPIQVPTAKRSGTPKHREGRR